MSKLELVKMFGKLEFCRGEVLQTHIDGQVAGFDYYSQDFSWNDINCTLDFWGRDNPTLSVKDVEDACADYILTKIGKSVEVQL